MKKIITALSFFLILSNVYALNSDAILLLKKPEIKNNPYDCTVVTGSRSIYEDVKLFGLNDSSVLIMKDEVSREILIKDIKSLKFKGRGFWKGAIIGGAIGFALGFWLGAELSTIDHDEPDYLGAGTGGGLLFGIPSALIGGGLGALFADDIFYDLSNLDFKAKRKKLKSLIKEYSDLGTQLLLPYRT